MRRCLRAVATMRLNVHPARIDGCSAWRSSYGPGTTLSSSQGTLFSVRILPGEYAVGTTLRGAGEAALVGDHHQLDAVASAELHQDPRDMGLRGQRAEDEALGDLGVGQSLRDEGEHLQLTRGEFVEP